MKDKSHTNDSDIVNQKDGTTQDPNIISGYMAVMELWCQGS